MSLKPNEVYVVHCKSSGADGVSGIGDGVSGIVYQEIHAAIAGIKDAIEDDGIRPCDITVYKGKKVVVNIATNVVEVFEVLIGD